MHDQDHVKLLLTCMLGHHMCKACLKSELSALLLMMSESVSLEMYKVSTYWDTVSAKVGQVVRMLCMRVA